MNEPTTTTTALTRPSLSQIAWVFARIGNTVYGGGTPTMAALEQEIVAKRRWLEPHETQLTHAVSRLTPGTNVLAFCVGTGWLLRRSGGAVVALAAASIPCSLLAVALTSLYGVWAGYPVARFALRGALASAVAIMVATCWTLIRPHWQHRFYVRVAVLFAATLALATIGNQSPIRVLGLAAVVGVLWPPSEAG
jgi:chromate transporter